MIYIDSDGIAADWLGYVLDNFFTDTKASLFNSLPDRIVRTIEMYRLDPHLFYNLNPIPGFRKLLYIVEQIGEYRILTAGADGLHECNDVVSDDKCRWWGLHYDVSKDKVINVLNGESKIEYAKSHKDILIDDRLATIKSFVDAGGCGIFIPAGSIYDDDFINSFIHALTTLSTIDPNNNGYISLM